MNAFIILNFALALLAAFFAGDCWRAHKGPRVFGMWRSELPHFLIFCGIIVLCTAGLAAAWILNIGRAVQ